MAGSEVKLYPYRWVVLAAFMLINVMVQVLWICYAPVASIAATAYGVQRADVDLLANLFLLIYIPIAFPAAWAIDTFGFKKAVGFGAILMAVFGLLRGVFPLSYTAALIGSIGISIGQPFLLNAFTKLAAEWFPQKQRATITGSDIPFAVSRDRPRRDLEPGHGGRPGLQRHAARLWHSCCRGHRVFSWSLRGPSLLHRRALPGKRCARSCSTAEADSEEPQRLFPVPRAFPGQRYRERRLYADRRPGQREGPDHRPGCPSDRPAPAGRHRGQRGDARGLGCNSGVGSPSCSWGFLWEWPRPSGSPSGPAMCSRPWHFSSWVSA